MSIASSPLVRGIHRLVRLVVGGYDAAPMRRPFDTLLANHAAGVGTFVALALFIVFILLISWYTSPPDYSLGLQCPPGWTLTRPAYDPATGQLHCGARQSMEAP
jgi:hypothetical protein